MNEEEMAELEEEKIRQPLLNLWTRSGLFSLGPIDSWGQMIVENCSAL